jgi:hypothetical protein
LTPSERVDLIQPQANQPIQCVKCGSAWFADVSFQQYSGNRYSTTPGGDMQVVGLHFAGTRFLWPKAHSIASFRAHFRAATGC